MKLTTDTEASIHSLCEIWQQLSTSDPATVPTSSWSKGDDLSKTPVTLLNEWRAQRHLPAPNYILLEVLPAGRDNLQTFIYKVKVGELSGTGGGTSKMKGGS